MSYERLIALGLIEPPHVEVRKAEIQGREHPGDVQRASYALVLTNLLSARFKETGAVDEALADRIEGILWPETVVTA